MYLLPSLTLPLLLPEWEAWVSEWAAQARQDPLTANVAAPTAVTNPPPAPPHPGIVAAPAAVINPPQAPPLPGVVIAPAPPLPGVVAAHAPPLPGVFPAPVATINLPTALSLNGVVAAPAAAIYLPPAAQLPGAIRRGGAPAPGRVYHHPPTMEQRVWIVIHFL